MEAGFHPRIGQVVLLEYDVAADGGPGDLPPLTALVIDPKPESVVLDLTCSARPPSQTSFVVASVFAPEALYRVHARALLDEPGRVVLDRFHDLETVQRRRWPRRPLCLTVSLVPVDDGDPVGVTGETIDIGIGGARVTTLRPLPAGVDPLVAFTMPDGGVLLVAARIVFAHTEENHCDYRLAFCDLDGNETAQLADLLRATPA